MSRTIKDRPFKIRMLENLKSGKVRHNHDQLGVSRKIRRTAEYEFLKRDAQGIHAFHQELQAEVYEYTTYEKEPYQIASALEDNVERSEYAPRKVVFVVRYDYRWIEYSAYCTDFEHYDPADDVDIRDGKTPACRPEYSMADYGYRSVYKEPYPRNTSAMKLQDIARYYNNGGSLEDLEDDSSAYEIGKHFKPSVIYYD